MGDITKKNDAVKAKIRAWGQLPGLQAQLLQGLQAQLDDLAQDQVEHANQDGQLAHPF